MMQAGLSSVEDVPSLKALWQTCFGDTQEEIDQFFSSLFVPEQTFTLRQGSSPAAMAVYFPLTLKLSGGTRSVAYLYAVCTDPAFRGRGLCTDLLEFAAGYLSMKGFDALALVPGSKDLSAFYEARGYAPFFYNETHTVRQWPELSGKLARAEAAEYAQIRSRLLEQCPALVYPEALLAYEKELCRKTGGDLVAFTDDGGRFGCAAVEYTKPGQVLCRELIWPGDPEEAAAILRPHFPAELYVLRTPPRHRREPFGLYRPLTGPQDGPAYLGFAFE